MKQAQRSFAGFDGNTFGVRWLRVFDLQFHGTEHLKNVLNEDKPVKISRRALRRACLWFQRQVAASQRKVMAAQPAKSTTCRYTAANALSRVALGCHASSCPNMQAMTRRESVY